MESTIKSSITPLQRLIRLLGTEKRDIWYVCLYALVAGLISMSLPLGVQAVFNLVSGGMVFSSVYVLIGLVVVGVVITGLIQIGQQALVEVLEQRLFAKAALEFTYRLPRIRPSALQGQQAPELMNRFFDVLTIQKGMPKLLIDLMAAAIQILFGIMLLSFYHPVFLVFGLFTLLAVIAIIWLLGPSGLRTSLSESKYKYKMAAWLEEIANRLSDYRNPQRVNEPLMRTDEYVGHYLEYRNQHFQVLKRFYYNALAFKTLVTGGLLILGTALVVERQMTLGQFVAAELVIVLITGSVEKLIMGIDTVFDMLTAVEKMGNVTDLPLDDIDPDFRENQPTQSPVLTPTIF
ncbi:ABC transporter transmembrane domain-containing protein [Larkinella terrae]|uniref:ABC transporter ATP-binding protein n=1 Tax=Larkinella terrae TaxID=2025311 RepID=A0A7K0EQC7_9BACT|nr:ABC transporter transmembrane domain-containing protein [Larkinella terrae]MRS63999.1 ABC transporter ATP-binding protein [Larkinella terrae]